jgi:hypothetical protein
MMKRMTSCAITMSPWLWSGVVTVALCPGLVFGDDATSETTSVEVSSKSTKSASQATATAQAEGHAEASSSGDVTVEVVTDDLATAGGIAARLESQIDFRIGVSCEPASEALRSQLQLKSPALLVLDVPREAPAAKAGVQRHDLLVQATLPDKEPVDLNTVEQLTEVIQQSEGKPIHLKLKRAGQDLTVQVTPTRDAAPLNGLRFTIPRLSGANVVILDQSTADGPGGGLNEQLIELPNANDPLGLTRHVIAMVLTDQATALPENVTVQVTRQGTQPAQIQVTRNGEEWKISENQLDQLPEDLRQRVAAMLAPGSQPANAAMQSRFAEAQTKARKASLEARLKAQREMRDQLLQDRGQGHPTVKVIKREIDALERQLEAMEKAAGKAVVPVLPAAPVPPGGIMVAPPLPAAPGGIPNAGPLNPAEMLRMQVQLSEQLQQLTKQLNEQQQMLKQLESRLPAQKAP